MTVARRLFTRGSWPETARIADILRLEAVGGVIVLAAAVLAVALANSPWAGAYTALRDHTVGPAALHLHMTLGQWAADGVLAIFFFIVGLELKREFVAGDLRDPRTAVLPVVAAIGGVVVPAAVFVWATWPDPVAMRGWASPAATDIAFSLAVLAVVGKNLPNALRTFLLTLAVVDDLIAVTIIAIFYTADLHVVPLLYAGISLAAFAWLVRRAVTRWLLLLPPALATWYFVHEAGIHATIAGVLLGFAVPVLLKAEGHGHGLAETFEHRLRPLSAGVAVPVFAFFAAGVQLDGLGSALVSPVALGVMGGLVIGKTVGITLTTWLLAYFTKASLDDDLSWWDVVAVSMVAGIGFTVSLLIGELAYVGSADLTSQVKVGVLVGSLLAAVLASVVLGLRSRAYRIIHERETEDADGDGIPDVYQR